MRTLLISLLLFRYTILAAQVPANDEITNAQFIQDVNGYCSADGAFSNIEATASTFRKGAFWKTAGKDVWFKFTALKTDINIVITGKNTSGSVNTLADPVAAIYTREERILTEMIGSMSTNSNVTTVYKGGLQIGQTYYIRVSAEDNATGSFKLCINNYTPAQITGQDCGTGIILCNKETVTALQSYRSRRKQ